jgi:hypothetical protein
VSDSQCTPLGLLCDPTGGVCVECLEQIDCRRTGGTCVQGVCATNGSGGATGAGGNSGRDASADAGGDSGPDASLGSGGALGSGGSSNGGASSGGSSNGGSSNGGSNNGGSGSGGLGTGGSSTGGSNSGGSGSGGTLGTGGATSGGTPGSGGAGGTGGAGSCTDGKQNGAETSTDCGGGTCPPCANDRPCKVHTDCLSGVCRSTFIVGPLTCKASTCTDKVAAGDETDVDCGGSTCPACAPGKKCVADADCLGDLTCSAGTCTGWALATDFEAGSVGPWQLSALAPGHETYSWQVVTSTAAAGTTRSLELSGGIANGQGNGLYVPFPPSFRPTYIGYWARSSSTTVMDGTFQVSERDVYNSGRIFAAWFAANGMIELHEGAGAIAQVPYEANRWYHIEFRNMDWTAHTFDFYVDDVLVLGGESFLSYPDVRRIDFFNYQPSTAWLDQVQIR